MLTLWRPAVHQECRQAKRLRLDTETASCAFWLSGHETSSGKSMTLHIGCHFQRRLCPCDGFLVGIRPSDSSAEPVALKRCRIFLQFLEAAMHSSGLFRTRGASVEAFILRLSRIRDFVLKHRFLHLTRNSLWGKACVHERHSAPPVFSG